MYLLFFFLVIVYHRPLYVYKGKRIYTYSNVFPFLFPRDIMFTCYGNLLRLKIFLHDCVFNISIPPCVIRLIRKG